VDGLVLALLAEAWPYAVALAVGLTLGLAVGGWKVVPLAACLTLVAAVAAYGVLTLTARGGQGYHVAFWESLGGDSVSAEGTATAVLPLAVVTAAWGVPAVLGAVVGTVLRRYGVVLRSAVALGPGRGG